MNFRIFKFFCLLTLILLSSCGENKSSDKVYKMNDTGKTMEDIYRDPKNYFKDCSRLFAYAREIDSTLYTQTDLDKELGNKAIKAFTDYAYYCANDSLSPVFLIKTGQVAMAIHNIPQAKTALEKCIQTYPEFKGITAAMFLLAQLYDVETYLNDKEEARKLYQELIDKYPESPEAESARGAIKFIGKTDKEIMEELKKQEAEKGKVNISIQ